MKDFHGYMREVRSIIAQGRKASNMNGVEYVGSRLVNGVTVHRVCCGKAERLPDRCDLWNHSPKGFEWGYGGSGPAQLALAILCDALQDDDRAIDLHQQFKWDQVARWPQSGFRITQDQVNDWVYQYDQTRADLFAKKKGGDGPVDLSEEANR